MSALLLIYLYQHKTKEHKMAGYNWMHGKSNNAVDAEERGLLKKGELKAWQKRAVDAGAVHPCEWHHTSKFFNETDYYDPEDFEELDPKDFPPEKKEPKPEKTLTRMTAWWEEWEGSRNYGRYVPQPVRQGVSDGTYFYYAEHRNVKVNLKTFKKLLREKKLRKKRVDGSRFHKA